MGLPTQIAARNRQTASLYPYPLTPLLGGLNLVSTSITAVILGDFILELLDGKMSVPAELAVTFVVATVTAIEQITSFIRQRFAVYPAKLNLALHLGLLILWIIAFGLLTSKISNMVLTHSCNLTLWQTEMGMLVCRMYKAMYAFSAVSVACAVAAVILDWSVLRAAAAGVYRPLDDQSPDMRKTMAESPNMAVSPDMRKLMTENVTEVSTEVDKEYGDETAMRTQLR